jgi:hypothetical protein
MVIHPLREQLIDPAIKYENAKGFDKPLNLNKCKTPIFSDIEEYIHTMTSSHL